MCSTSCGKWWEISLPAMWSRIPIPAALTTLPGPTVPMARFAIRRKWKAEEIIKWILQHQNVYDIKRQLTAVYNTAFDALFENPYGHIRGRFYDIRIEELNKRCCFIGSWHKTSQEMYKYVADMIKDEYGVTFTDYYILNGTRPMINLFNTQQDQQPTMQDMRKQFMIHLANQQDKRNALADFRRTRDEKNAKKFK